MTKHYLVTVTTDERTRMLNDDGVAADLQVVIERFTEVWSTGPVPAVHVLELEPGQEVRVHSQE